MNTVALRYAFGSVPGSRHRALGKPSQDAATVRPLPNGNALFAVADGCSSGKHSEFGARLGVQALAAALAAHPIPQPDHSAFWQSIHRHVLNELEYTLRLFEDRRAAIYDFLLFTLVGCLIANRSATFFHLGDGTIFINGREFPIEAENNTPPYLSYALLGSEVFPIEKLQFHVVQTVPLADLGSALIGTDGVNELVRAEEETIPGRIETVGPIADLWATDTCFQNRHSLQRKLNRLNPNPPPWRRGLLGDDTTLFVFRKEES